MLNKQRRIAVDLEGREGRQARGPRAVRRMKTSAPAISSHPPRMPSLSIKQTDDPLRDDPVAAIDNSCRLRQLRRSKAAVSVCRYRAEIIHNPTRFDRLLARFRSAVIGFLQSRRERRRIAFPA